MYKSMRDALRYRQKKITGKSDDSGNDEMFDNMAEGDTENDDYLAFLSPTRQKFPRTTMSIGAAAKSSSEKLNESPFNDYDSQNFNELSKMLEVEHVNSQSMEKASVYSYVSSS